MRDKIRSFGTTADYEVYRKGDSSEDFNGVLFAKFGRAQDGVYVLQKWFSCKPTMNREVTWCNNDRPIDERVCLSSLIGVKRQLWDWVFNKNSVKENDEILTLEISTKPVLTVSVQDRQLLLGWPDKNWESWNDLTQSAEIY